MKSCYAGFGVGRKAAFTHTAKCSKITEPCFRNTVGANCVRPRETAGLPYGYSRPEVAVGEMKSTKGG
ncbi:MAG: hypothetical protein IKC72_04770 [Clostridia bacterium]|nr:hypothetical protein [Clostridia bacterium]